MAAVMMLSALFAAQAITSVPGPEPVLIQEKDAAYEALAAGETDAAIRKLEAQLLEEPNDPLLLINLGTAYARIGKTMQAAAAYRAARDSKTLYRVELADGSWVESKVAARRGLARLDHVDVLASADFGN